MLIARYAQEALNDPMVDLCCAPPREALKVFGGSMTIDEFRNNTHRITMTLPPMKIITYDIEKHQQTVKQSPTYQCDNDTTDEDMFMRNQSVPRVMNNPLKIKNKSTATEAHKSKMDNVLGMFSQSTSSSSRAGG